MATVDEHPAATNGTAAAAGDIAVENPATGEVIAHVPGHDRRAGGRPRARRARRAAGLGGARASRAAAASCAARRSGSSTTPSASSRRSSPRPARPTRTPCIAEVMYGANAFGFWAKNAAGYLADERVKTAAPLLEGQEADPALPAAGRRRRHRPVELPADELRSATASRRWPRATPSSSSPARSRR